MLDVVLWGGRGVWVGSDVDGVDCGIGVLKCEGEGQRPAPVPRPRTRGGWVDRLGGVVDEGRCRDGVARKGVREGQENCGRGSSLPCMLSWDLTG